MKEYYAIVNEYDEVVGKISEDEKVKDYRQLRFANIILYKGDKIIVPKRTITKKMYPGCYDFSGGGHVNYEEDYLDAIIRETKEELNIDIYDIKELGYYNPYKDNVGCFSKLYTAKYDLREEINYAKDEIEEIYYYTADEILKMIDDTPELFKSDYITMFKKIFDKNKF